MTNNKIRSVFAVSLFAISAAALASEPRDTVLEQTSAVGNTVVGSASAASIIGTGYQAESIIGTGYQAESIIGTGYQAQVQSIIGTGIQ